MIKKAKILVVEDEPDLLNIMQTKLKAEGFEVIPLETGRDVLKYLETKNPDLVLLDILLPDIDGLTILNEIAKGKKTKNMPVIILSNLADQGSFDQAKAIGGYDYMVKSKVELNEVVDKIKKKLKIQ